MTSQLDLAGLTELDLPNGRGTGLTRLDLSGYDLGGHSWNQLPVGVFDGLDSLEILRIAYAGYQDRGINFVDEDIFRGLDTLRELDVRPIRPSDDVLAPLTSLETLNGQDYTP